MPKPQNGLHGVDVSETAPGTSQATRRRHKLNQAARHDDRVQQAPAVDKLTAANWPPPQPLCQAQMLPHGARRTARRGTVGDAR